MSAILGFVLQSSANAECVPAPDPDLNNDGIVTIADLFLVTSKWGLNEGSPGYDPIADTNCDGTVNLTDVQFVQLHIGEEFPTGETIPVPDVVGLAQAAAEASIVSAGLAVGAITTANSDTVPTGNVISQTPTAGNAVPVGSAVGLVISLGSATVSVPNVVGLSQAAAETAIVGAGLTVGIITTANSDTVPEGDVISQSPAPGTEVPVGSSVNLVISLGAADTDAPDLSILSPREGALVVNNQPPIEVSFSDISGVDTATLAFTANSDPIDVNCDFNGTGGSCTPTNPLPEGVITLVASVDDVLGNTATTQIQFTVDSLPVEISIASPSDGLITKEPEIEVTGEIGPDVTGVTVNGVVATLGNSFSATVPLREGTNMLVAVATKASGKTGTDSLDVTRDIVAPIVRINSPRDGFVSVNDVVAVTGQVNDIVNGATNAQVFVNGIEATVSDGAFMVTDLPLVRGPNTVEAVATDAVGNQGSHSITVNFQPPVGARINIESGNGQSAFPTQALPDPLVVAVKDDLGNPVAGRMVTFEVTRNSGTLKTNDTGTPKRTVQLPSDGSGRAAVHFTLGDTAGEGNNRVRVTALGVAGEVEFCESAVAISPDKILMTSGDNQRGVVGHPLANPLEALVVDVDGNPIGDVMVTFTVLSGDGNLNGEQSLVRVTGTDGIVRAVLTLGTEPGINNNVVNASFTGLTGLPATFVSSGLTPRNPDETRFSGVVLDSGHNPIPGAVVSIEGTTVSNTTDNEGQFLLMNVPVGHIHLLIDPTNSPRPETFPPLAFETVTVAGQNNNLGQPILIPALDTEGSMIVGGDEDVTLKMKGVAGLELNVFANSVTCPDGSNQCRVTISQVHLDKVPMPPPSGTIFMPPAWTVQPAGTLFDPPARISIPNDGLPPGRVIDIFQFDHTLNEFINVGKGTVSDDAFVIVSDPGFGITRAGWGGCGQPQPPTTCTCTCNDTTTGDCHKPGCNNGSITSEIDDSDKPPDDGLDNCLTPDCLNGLTILRADPDWTACQDDGDPFKADVCYRGSCRHLTDSDGDGKPDDSDNDGIPDDLDKCPGFDDNIDVDRDGKPDGCDNLIDSDGDGVADADDQCPGFDDNIDVDRDGKPDGCDNLIDSDGDGVADADDQCPGFDDNIDVDRDGKPDGCDNLIDSDGDGVADADDQCPGFDDNIDTDNDGRPNDCDDCPKDPNNSCSDRLQIIFPTSGSIFCPGSDVMVRGFIGGGIIGPIEIRVNGELVANIPMPAFPFNFSATIPLPKINSEESINITATVMGFIGSESDTVTIKLNGPFTECDSDKDGCVDIIDPFSNNPQRCCDLDQDGCDDCFKKFVEDNWSASLNNANLELEKVRDALRNFNIDTINGLQVVNLIRKLNSFLLCWAKIPNQFGFIICLGQAVGIPDLIDILLISETKFQAELLINRIDNRFLFSAELFLNDAMSFRNLLPFSCQDSDIRDIEEQLIIEWGDLKGKIFEFKRLINRL